ncbi:MULTISPECIES: hypothetical protein [unclassified Isoptericola]|uniref:hypothetical protein n=1 Tax=unclassified Isoptericola TaxID=2623355 RepID=UPI0036532116
MREIQDLVELAAARLRMPAHPDWPRIGQVPEDLSEYDFVEDDVTPAMLRDTALAMGLSRDQADKLLAGTDAGHDRA